MNEVVLDRKIRVLIVDDHAVVRQGLRTFLELQDKSALAIEIVGEAANGIEAVELARSKQPDIVLLDLVMPEMDGLQATPRIIESSPQSRVIILTSFGEDDKVLPVCWLLASSVRFFGVFGRIFNQGIVLFLLSWAWFIFRICNEIFG